MIPFWGKRMQPPAHSVTLEGVDRYQVVEPMFEGLRVILSYRGEPYSPAYIQGISGAAFRVGGICPCAPTCGTAMQPQDLAQRWVTRSNTCPSRRSLRRMLEHEHELAEVLTRIKTELRAGTAGAALACLHQCGMGCGVRL